MTKTVNIGLFLWCACSLCLGQDLAPPILAPGDAPPLPTLGLAACLTGRNEVPANDSPYKGSGKFTLNGTLLNYEVTLACPTLTPTKAGIYGPAADGTNGEVIFVWTNRSMVPGLPGSTFRGAWRYKGTHSLTPEQAAQVKAGLWYVNIQSGHFPDGELRGQISSTDPDADSDGDGVANKNDLCPDTPGGAVVDAQGCSIQQLVPCSIPWATHDEYVETVAYLAAIFCKENRITEDQRDAIVKQAQDSNCGNPAPPADVSSQTAPTEGSPAKAEPPLPSPQ